MIWLIILSRVKLSVAYPIISLGYVMSIFFSWIFFKESVPRIRVLGRGDYLYWRLSGRNR